MTLIPTEPVGLETCESFAFGLDHSEGIAVTPAGDIYVGGEAGQIYRIENDAPKQVASTGGFLLGLAADADSRIYAIDNVAKSVWRFDPAHAAISTPSSDRPEAPFRVPNWGAFDAAGNYYLTDSGDWMADDGRIWVVRRGGAVELWTDECSAFPNGCCLSPDGDRLFVVESVPGAIVEVADRKVRQGRRAPRALRTRHGGARRRRLRDRRLADHRLLSAGRHLSLASAGRALDPRRRSARHGACGTDQRRLHRAGPGHAGRARTSAAGI